MVRRAFMCLFPFPFCNPSRTKGCFEQRNKQLNPFDCCSFWMNSQESFFETCLCLYRFDFEALSHIARSKQLAIAATKHTSCVRIKGEGGIPCCFIIATFDHRSDQYRIDKRNSHNVYYGVILYKCFLPYFLFFSNDYEKAAPMRFRKSEK